MFDFIAPKDVSLSIDWFKLKFSDLEYKCTNVDNNPQAARAVGYEDGTCFRDRDI